MTIEIPSEILNEIPDTLKPEGEKPRETAASDAIAGLSLPARMEAILYLKGRPLTLRELAEIAAISREQA